MDKPEKKVERTVKLDPDAAELLLQLAGGARKQGAYLSELIRTVAAARQLHKDTSESEIDALRREVQELAGEVARLRVLVEGENRDK